MAYCVEALPSFARLDSRGRLSLRVTWRCAGAERPKKFIFGRVFLWCSSYVHRRKKITMQRTHLNIVATLETSIGRLPANIEAERSILGAVFPENHPFKVGADHFKPEGFSIDPPRP